MLPVVVNQQTPAFRNFRGTVELNSDLRLRRAHARAARVDQGMDLNGARQAACRRDDFGSAGGGRPGPDERHHLGRQSPPAGIAAVSCGSPPNDCATTIRDYAHGCGCPAVARSASLAASSDSPTKGFFAGNVSTYPAVTSSPKSGASKNVRRWTPVPRIGENLS